MISMDTCVTVSRAGLVISVIQVRYLCTCAHTLTILVHMHTQAYYASAHGHTGLLFLSFCSCMIFIVLFSVHLYVLHKCNLGSVSLKKKK